jgi:hypothetical protein
VNVKHSAPRLHAITSVYLTNQGLPTVIDYGIKRQPENNKINQFLTALHSTSRLEIFSADFYIKLDSDFEFTKNILSERITQLYPRVNIYWNRLETFADWQNVSKSISKDIEIILLQSNHDHAFIGESVSDASKFIQGVTLSGERAIGLITHWPEEIASAELRSIHNSRINYQYFQRTDTCVIGTCLVTPKLFKEWWRQDFTQGKKITRPDNPFGPDVKFEVATVLVPNRELFRHLDGYGHVGVSSRIASPLQNCCTISSNQISHKNWIYGNMLNKKLLMDLPSIQNYGSGISSQSKLQLILLASSYRFRRSIVSQLIQDSNGVSILREMPSFVRLVKERNFIKILIRQLIFFLWLENRIIRRIRKLVRLSLNRI